MYFTSPLRLVTLLCVLRLSVLVIAARVGGFGTPSKHTARKHSCLLRFAHIYTTVDAVGVLPVVPFITRDVKAGRLIAFLSTHYFYEIAA